MPKTYDPLKPRPWIEPPSRVEPTQVRCYAVATALAFIIGWNVSGDPRIEALAGIGMLMVALRLHGTRR